MSPIQILALLPADSKPQAFMDELYALAMQGPVATTEAEAAEVIGRMMDRSIDYMGVVLTDDLSDFQSMMLLDAVNHLWNWLGSVMESAGRQCYTANTFNRLFSQAVNTAVEQGLGNGETV
jgi:hypothetical protein